MGTVTQWSVALPWPAAPVQLAPLQPDQGSHLLVAHWLSLVHQQCWFEGSAAPVVQLAVQEGKVSGTQWSVALPAFAAPVQLLPVHLAHVAHLLLAHWLSLVHQQCWFEGSAAPVAQVDPLELHVRTSGAQLSAPPVPAAPEHVPVHVPAGDVHLPLAHWPLSVQTQLELLQVPAEHAKAPLAVHANAEERVVQAKPSLGPLPVQRPAPPQLLLVHLEPVPHCESLLHWQTPFTQAPASQSPLFWQVFTPRCSQPKLSALLLPQLPYVPHWLSCWHWGAREPGTTQLAESRLSPHRPLQFCHQLLPHVEFPFDHWGTHLPLGHWLSLVHGPQLCAPSQDNVPVGHV
jgi:hypothetical protein